MRTSRTSPSRVTLSRLLTKPPVTLIPLTLTLPSRSHFFAWDPEMPAAIARTLDIREASKMGTLLTLSTVVSSLGAVSPSSSSRQENMLSDLCGVGSTFIKGNYRSIGITQHFWLEDLGFFVMLRSNFHFHSTVINFFISIE